MNTYEPNKRFDVWLAVRVMGWGIVYESPPTDEQFNGTYHDWDKENRRHIWTGFVTEKIQNLYSNLLCHNIPQVVWEPTANIEQAINMLEFYLDNHKEYSYVELVYEEDWDLGWYVILTCKDDSAEYHPNAHGWNHGLAFAICAALWRAVTENEFKEQG